MNKASSSSSIQLPAQRLFLANFENSKGLFEQVRDCQAKLMALSQLTILGSHFYLYVVPDLEQKNLNTKVYLAVPILGPYWGPLLTGEVVDFAKQETHSSKLVSLALTELLLQTEFNQNESLIEISYRNQSFTVWKPMQKRFLRRDWML